MVVPFGATAHMCTCSFETSVVYPTIVSAIKMQCTKVQVQAARLVNLQPLRATLSHKRMNQPSAEKWLASGTHTLLSPTAHVGEMCTEGGYRRYSHKATFLAVFA